MISFCTGESAGYTAQRFTERAGNNIHTTHHAAMFMRAATGFSHKSGGMGVVDHDHGAVFFCQITNAFQIGNIPSIEKRRQLR